MSWKSYDKRTWSTLNQWKTSYCKYVSMEYMEPSVFNNGGLMECYPNTHCCYNSLSLARLLTLALFAFQPEVPFPSLRKKNLLQRKSAAMPWPGMSFPMHALGLCKAALRLNKDVLVAFPLQHIWPFLSVKTNKTNVGKCTHTWGGKEQMQSVWNISGEQVDCLWKSTQSGVHSGSKNSHKA